MTDFLDKLIVDAENRIANGYYDVDINVDHDQISLSRAIRNSSHNAIIAEIKPKSPSRGPLRAELDAKDTAIRLARGGATGLSILTEPDNFGGTIHSLAQIRPYVNIPLLMKDVVIDESQIAAAKKSGADCVLLMLSALNKKRIRPGGLIKKAHNSRLEVLLEVHDTDELEQASQTNAEIIGINNRNLGNLAIDLNTTRRLLESAAQQLQDRTVISESGVDTIEDIRRLKGTRIDGFLIGSSIMLATDLEGKVREFVNA